MIYVVLIFAKLTVTGKAMFSLYVVNLVKACTVLIKLYKVNHKLSLTHKKLMKMAEC